MAIPHLFCILGVSHLNTGRENSAITTLEPVVFTSVTQNWPPQFLQMNGHLSLQDRQQALWALTY